PTQIWVKSSFWIFSFGIYLFTIFVFLTFDQRSVGQNFGRLMALLILSILPKLIILAFMFGEDIYRFVAGIFNTVKGSSEEDFWPERRKFISQTALLLSTIPFLGIIHGVLIGKYRYRVIRHTLQFDDLPEAF